jgi:hypothetical protein
MAGPIIRHVFRTADRPNIRLIRQPARNVPVIHQIGQDAVAGEPQGRPQVSTADPGRNPGRNPGFRFRPQVTGPGSKQGRRVRSLTGLVRQAIPTEQASRSLAEW